MAKYSLLRYEIDRYKYKGLNHVLVGVVMLFSYFCILPYFGKNIFGPLIEQYLYQNGDVDQKINYIIFVTILHIFVTFGCFTCFIPLYMGKISIFEKYRVNRIEDWEWNKPGWEKLKSRFIKTYLLNHLVLLPGFVILDQLILGNTISFRTSFASFPTIQEFSSQILFCIFIDDSVFYWIHWILHLPLFYKRIHKKHHEFKNPFSLTGEFDSIPEYYIAGTLPPLIAFAYLGSSAHMFSYFGYVIFKLGKQIDQHCGYEFDFSPYHVIPFTGSGISHTFHHTHNEGSIGNFFSFWDHIMGTDQQFIKYFYSWSEKKMLQRQQQIKRIDKKKETQDKTKAL